MNCISVVGVVLIVVTGIVTPAGVSASSKETAQARQKGLQNEADFWHEKMQTSTEGIVLGMLTNEKRQFAVAGQMTEAGPAVDENTLFEIGSITKIFTGILLADTILHKKAALNDIISKHLPKGTISKSSPLAKITLLDLATHMSGLPRLPSDLSKGRKVDNPYKHYSRDLLLKYLSNFDSEDLGEVGKYLYSNTGFALLGEILAIINETTYDRLLHTVILAPLNMSSTFVQVSSESIPKDLEERFSQGHNKGKTTSHWSLNAFAGAGGIVSSAHDLLIFANAQWDSQIPTKLQNALKFSTKPRTDKMGLGWNITPRGLVHGGGTGGFRSQLEVSIVNKTAKVSLKNGTGPKQKVVRRGDFKKIEGYWKGTLDTGVKELRSVMRLSSEGSTILYSIDQGGVLIPALKTEFDNTHFFTYYPTINGIFSGVLGDNGNLLEGTWTQRKKYSFKMERSSRIPASLRTILKEKYIGDYSGLTGFWKGHIGGSKGLLVFLEIEQFDNVHELKIWSPSQSPLPIEVSMAKYQKNKLYIEAKDIGGHYTGQLSKDSKVLDGIWNQGEETPVTLHWSAVRPKNE
jgi:serine-type D-Ala-D-Ala carboxypeptidase/endopeptidase